MIFHLITQMKKQLGLLDTWLEKAEADAKARSFDPAVFVAMRLAPDQFALARQVQSACDTAKFTAARLAGKESPSHPDNEQTVAELRARVQTTLKYLDTFAGKDFEGAATRVISQARWEGKTMTGADYLVEYGVPNFYFHVTHVYAILRHNGVSLGKRDFLGALTMHGG
jgi:hypothetical protein